MKLTMLGTGSAFVTRCYNTCYVIDDDGRLMLCDAGGGNGILSQLEKAGYDWKDIKDIFVTHKHMDHFMGIMWLVRRICQAMYKSEYIGDARIYAHDEVIALIRLFAEKLLLPRETAFIDKRLFLVEVKNGDTQEIIGHNVQFFDVCSTKTKQFGYVMDLENGDKLVCAGDEPLKEKAFELARDAKWLLHEAYCLYSQREEFQPYEKHHSTVKDACELAEELNVENLLLYHTEDKNYANRKALYVQEGEQYFSGNLVVPNDLEIIEI